MSESWQWLTLDDVLIQQANRKKVQQGWSPKCHDFPAATGEWGVLKTTAIQAGRFEPEHNKALPDHLDPKPGIEVESGDLLITCAGPRSRCGVPTLVRSTPERLMMSGKMYRFRPDDRLDSRFLELWLLSPDAQRQIDAMKTGISDSGLNLTHARFTRLPVPAPPLAEQLRIVDLLEDHLSHLDAAETSAGDGLRRTATLRRAHLREAFDQRAAELRPLLDVASIANGQTPRGLVASLSSAPGDDAVPFFKVGDMNAADGRWMNDARFYVSCESAEQLGLHVRPAGTVLIPKRGGAIATNKKRILRSPAAYDLNTMGLVPNDSLDSSYLWHWLQTVDLGRIADGSNVPQINATQIRELQLPVPDLEAQVSIANRLDEIDEGLSRLAEQVESVRRRGSGLRRALLSDAFSGRLTSDAAAGLSEVEEVVSQ